MITVEDVADCMAMPVAAYPLFPFERPQLLAYYELLRDLPCDKTDLFEAVKECLRISHFFPTVALIREEVLRKPTYTAPQFDAKELTNAKAVSMPDYVKQLRDDLKQLFPSYPVSEAFGEFVDSSRVAPTEPSEAVSRLEDTEQVEL